ncbi:hypothetical protein BCR34DRAFT_600509 [Clohesyomyces aquaticus]|uniref:Uncharacterized protein n=1 Tax=Clohesyomyces aquaticus TaxID=1231657 RepID=A0A1Y1ZQU8_9PLEO|nr:hypothetical protein BCR34DRAFT_600509 [Clohesyomyces aquaticus]
MKPNSESGIDQLLLYSHSVDFFQTGKTGKTRKSKDAENEKHLVISFAALNRMRLRSLQAQVVENVMQMYFRNTIPDGWDELLSNYMAAVRDNDFLQAEVDRSEDPFVVHCERVVDATE